MTTPVLEVTDLVVQFGGVRAVNEVSFELASAEILGVIGPNGAGKTTVFDAISGFVPARGAVRLAGKEIGALGPEARSRAGLGRSFQDARLFPSLTVAETLAVALERHVRGQDVVSTAVRMPWISRAERRIKVKVEELIELMGLGAFRDKFISELSTGSRRIVDLAVIMAHEPTVLLLDEPSSGIAQRETEALAPMLLRLRQETGASLVVVEHDMPLIQAVSDELLALETGAVLTRGKPQEVLEDPRLVAAYLGTDQAAIARSGVAAAAANGSAARPSRRRARQAPAVAGASRRSGNAVAEKKTKQAAIRATTVKKKATGARKTPAAPAVAAKKVTAKKAAAKATTRKKAAAAGKKPTRS